MCCSHPARLSLASNETGGPWALEGLAPSRLEIPAYGGDGRLSPKATALVPSCGSVSNSNFYVVAKE